MTHSRALLPTRTRTHFLLLLFVYAGVCLRARGLRMQQVNTIYHHIQSTYLFYKTGPQWWKVYISCIYSVAWQPHL